MMVAPQPITRHHRGDVHPTPEGPPKRRTHLRAVRPGGFAQVMRRPFLDWCTSRGRVLRLDERGLLVWLLLEAHRRHHGVGGCPVLSLTKAAIAEALGITRRRVARMLDALMEVGAVAWEPGRGGAGGELVVVAYDELVADGRQAMGPDYCQTWCGPVDDDVARLGFEAWSLLVLVALEVGSVTRSLAGPATGLALHLGVDRRRLRRLAEDLEAAGEVEWSPGSPGSRSPVASLVVADYGRLVAIGTRPAAYDLGVVRIDSDGRLERVDGASQRESARCQREIAQDVRTKSHTAPAVSSPHRQDTCATPSTPPPQPNECSTPPTPEAESRGGREAGAEDDQADGEAVLDELVEDLAAWGYEDLANRLEHTRRRNTRALRALRAGAGERVHVGWDPVELATELVRSRELDDVSHVDHLLLSRLEAIPVEPPAPEPPRQALVLRREKPLGLAPSVIHPAPTVAAGLALMGRSQERQLGRACPDCCGRGVVELDDGTAARCRCVDRGRP